MSTTWISARAGVDSESSEVEERVCESGRRGTRTCEKGVKGDGAGGEGSVMKSIERVEGVGVGVAVVRKPCIRGMVGVCAL
jgi:hypothetical protein